MQEINQKYLLSILEYNKETGVFLWKKREGNDKSSKIFNALYAGNKAGSIHSSKRSVTRYIAIKIGKKSYKAHRLAFIMTEGRAPKEVDHINHNGLDNSWSNLRSSNRRDNQKNLPRQKSNKSGCIGVNWHKAAKKWQARAVDMSGKRVDLGRYRNIEDAVKARKKYEKEFKYYQHREAMND